MVAHDHFSFPCRRCGQMLSAPIANINQKISCGECTTVQIIPLPPVKVQVSGNVPDSVKVENTTTGAKQGLRDSATTKRSGEDARQPNRRKDDGPDLENPTDPVLVKLVFAIVMGAIGLTLGAAGIYGWRYYHRDDPAVYDFVKTRVETIRDACTRVENATEALSDHKREYSVAFEQGLSPMVLNDYAHAVADAQSTMERKRVEVNSLQHNLIEAWLKDQRSYLDAMKRLRAEADARGQQRLAELADDFIKYFSIVTTNGGVQLDDDSFTSALLQRDSHGLTSQAVKSKPQ